ncbi:YkyA family protein [Risungbinella massiliensis]|uniref:YkyA family protein n=1 Tax=Risungbinella massiliensis TaxID=1329796 RepID=UPI0005CC8871|nr:YkyA family protein [Risungbinella massiliensis]
MKKLLNLVGILILLTTGCTAMGDTISPSQLAQEMNVQVRGFNQANASHLTELEKLDQETVTMLNQMPNPNAESKPTILGKIEEQKKVLSTLQSKIEKIGQSLPDLQTKSAQLSDQESQKQATTFLQSFTKVYQLEQDLLQKNQSYLVSQQEYLQNISPEKQEKLNQLKEEINKAYQTYTKEVEKFNQSWKKFVETSANGKVGK